MNKAIFIVGPTASGKSDAAIELSRNIPSEIVSCDSMQVYEGMDIGTGKVDKNILSTIPHHLIDIIDPSKNFDVAQYIEYARLALKKIKKNKKIPVFVGGSGLYINALLYGICNAPAQNRKIRKRLLLESEEKGVEYLFNQLKKVDPAAASGIRGLNLRRIIRALEVYESTGLSISRYRENTESIISGYDKKIFGLMMDRKVLYERINKRVVHMFNKGLVQEVRNLYNKGMGLTASVAVGYKEVIEHLKGNIPIEDTIALVQRNTRRYAKRQMTWFRKNKNIEWINATDKSSKDIANKILSLYTIK
jgi:tRNA dimethylallyltransferase